MQLNFKNNICFKLILIAVFFVVLYSCRRVDHQPPKASEESANVVYDWYKLMAKIQLFTTPGPAVPANNRSFGYIGVGLYEAVRPGIKDAVSLSTKLYQMPTMPEADKQKQYLWAASANAALASLAKQFLVSLTDANRASIDSLENAYNNRFKLSTADAVISRSQAYGRAVASVIYDWSTSDNFTLSPVGYVIPVFPGSWVPTPPAMAPPVGPFLANSRPFLQSSVNTEIPEPPVAYSTDPASPFYKAAKEVYDIGKNLTAEQKATANFWADVVGAGVALPGPGHILAIITSLLEKKGVKLGQAVQVYAKTGIAMKDAFYLCWKGKFKYNLLRPITYINRLIDPAWTSYLVTPPYPEYPSGLAGIYTPIMQILIREFGDVPITDNTYTVNGLTSRQFASISALIDEAAISRVYAGIHYRFTQDATVVMGKVLGNRIADINLQSSAK